MKAEIRNESPNQISGVYIPEEGEQAPQCTWAFSRETGEIYDLTETAVVVVGYAKTDKEAIGFLEGHRA